MTQKHRHDWQPDGGCSENPGVFSQGSTMRFCSVCECGAHKVVVTDVRPGHDERTVRITRAAEVK